MYAYVPKLLQEVSLDLLQILLKTQENVCASQENHSKGNHFEVL